MLDSKSGESSVATKVNAAFEGMTPGEDIAAAINVSRQLKTGGILDPGDSRTLLIMLRMLLWSTKTTRKVCLSPMQVARQVEDDPEIATWTLEKMLTLSNGTTQFASAAILLQNRKPDEIEALIRLLPPEKRPMIQLTKTIKTAWLKNHTQNNPFSLEQLEPEAVLQRQARHYYSEQMSGTKIPYHATHSEEAIYAVLHGDMLLEEAAARFPMLRSHETDRIAEIEKVLCGDVVDSIDHRIVQAALLTNTVAHWTSRSEKAVRKTWPDFFEFLQAVKDIKSSNESGSILP